MIEQALYQHLQAQEDLLLPYLSTYDGKLAIFNQEPPADSDKDWGDGPQYGRIVFAVDLKGDPERIMGGKLAVDILCEEDKQFPEEIEPIIRSLIHGYFFSHGTFTVAAQWKASSYFTQATDRVTGCTVVYDLLAFPVITTADPDVVARFNAWCADIPNLHVINLDPLPETAWKPSDKESAIYWRVMTDNPANWIPDTYQTIWRTATLKAHIFSETSAAATAVSRDLLLRLYAAKRLLKPGETPIMVNRRNTANNGADPLKTGQVTVEATYGVIVHFERGEPIRTINYPR